MINDFFSACQLEEFRWSNVKTPNINHFTVKGFFFFFFNAISRSIFLSVLAAGTWGELSSTTLCAQHVS